MDALKSFPKTETKLYTKKGTAVCQKIDIFQGRLWYAYEGEWMNWHELTTEHANEIITANRKKEPVASLEEFASELIVETTVDFGNVVGQDSLTRFDKPKTSNKRRNNRKKKRSNSDNKPQAKRTQTKGPKKSKQGGQKAKTTQKPQKEGQKQGGTKPNNRNKKRPHKPKPNA